MAKKVVSLKKASATQAERVRAPVPALGPGLHAARIEMIAGESYRVRTLAGVRLVATLDDTVTPELVEECLRDGRRVILCDTERGPAIVGALQTAPSVARRDDGALVLQAKDIKLHADRALVIEAGPVALRLDRAGALRVEGDKMVVDMGSVIRFLAARVELP